MSPKLTELQKLYRRYVIYATIMLAFLVAALICVFVNRYLVFILLALAVVFHLALLRPLQKNYTRKVCEANLEQTLCRLLGADSVSEEAPGAITAETVTASKLMPMVPYKNSPLLRWQISGERKGIRVSLCDATIAQEFRLKTKGKRRMHFNAGVWVHIALPKKTDKRFFLLDETSVPTPIRLDHFKSLPSFESVILSDKELADHVALYRTIHVPSHEPSDAFMNEFRRLVHYTPGYVAVSVDEDHMDLFIRGRFLTRPVSISKKPEQSLISFDPFPELSYIVSLASSL